MDINTILKGVKCQCGKHHTCDIESVYVESGAINKLRELTNNYNKILIVADENTYNAGGKRVSNLLKDKVKREVVFSGATILIPDEVAIERVKASLDGIDLIIGVGSGVIQDLCKYTSFFEKVPYMIVATAPSMDGYASTGAAMILKGMKETVSAGLPKAIIADTDILRQAPMEMIKAGYGDIIGKYSALCDWKLANIVNSEYLCPYIYDTTYQMIEKTLKTAKGLLKREEESVRILTEALMIVGIMMSFATTSRPASGSEHHLSHFFEITGIVHNKEYLPHGIDVAYSTVITAQIRESLLKNGIPNEQFNLEKEEYENAISQIYGSVANGCIALQKKVGSYERDRISIYKSKEKEIREVLSEMPSAKEIEEMLLLVELDMSQFYNVYGREKIAQAIMFAKDLKDRYTVLWMNYDCSKRGLVRYDRMTVAGHRGDSYNYYENTMTAFEMAYKSGADMIETDVRLTLDNKLVLVHDDTVERTTKKKGRVAEMTLSEIKGLNAGDSSAYEAIPTLEELLVWAQPKNLTLNLEIKEYWSEKNQDRCIDCIEQVIALVEKYNLSSRVVINSFDAWVLEYVYKKYGKKYLLHGFYPYWEMKNVSIDPQQYLYCACIFDNENKELYDYLIERGIQPWVGASITQKSKLDICRKYGAKLITTNNPSDVLRKLKD